MLRLRRRGSQAVFDALVAVVGEADAAHEGGVAFDGAVAVGAAGDE